jgi:hypothetical protein
LRETVSGKTALVASSKPNQTHSELICGYCKKKGHIKRDCFKRKASEARKSQKNKNSPEDKANKTSDSTKVPTKVNALYAALHSTQRDSSGTWCIDSGATHHMSNNDHRMNKYQNLKQQNVSTAASDNHLSVQGKGEIIVNIATGQAQVKDVLHIPNLSENLMSVSQIVNKDFIAVFAREDCKIYHKNYVKIEGVQMFNAPHVDNLFKFNGDNLGQASVSKAELSEAESDIEEDSKRADNFKTWHKKLGHINGKHLIALSKRDVGIGQIQQSNDVCAPCQKGKQSRKSFSNLKGTRALGILDLVHSDLVGPLDSSLGGNRWILTFIDDFSRMAFTYFLKFKDQVFSKFKEFKAAAELETGRRIKTLRTDNGREYVNANFTEFLSECGIKHQLTIVYTPEQNGVAERFNRTICEKARAMMIDSQCSTQLWAEAVNTACYIKNRSPHSALNGEIPLEIWSGTKVDLSNLHAFGCKAYMHIPKIKRHSKWDPKSKETMFVGYYDNKKGYRLYDPRTRNIEEARDVVFDKNFMFKDQNNVSENIVVFDPILSKSDQVQMNDQSIIKSDDSRDNNDSDSVTENSKSSDESVSVPDVTVESENDVQEVQGNFDQEIIVEKNQDLRRSSRTRKVKEFPDFIVYSVAFDQDIPKTFEEACSSLDKAKWELAVKEELASQEENGTWTIIDRPKNAKVIPCKWVFKIKETEGDKPLKYKARLVAKGFSQRKGIDYEETFSPTVRKGSLRLLFALAAQNDLEMVHLDVKTAFLNGKLDETIYMSVPDGSSIENKENKVCHLQKSMYGLKQASRNWNERVHRDLTSFGLKQSKNDSCVYYKHSKDCMIFVSVYVDDFFIFCNNKIELSRLKESLMNTYKMEDLGPIQKCLGIRVTRDRKNGMLMLDQTQYIDKILSEFGMSNCKPTGTPMAPNAQFLAEAGETNVPYQNLIGVLNFIANSTRPDILYTVVRLSQYNNSYNQEHWSAALRVLRYLKETNKRCLVYKKGENPTLQGYVDADWGGDKRDCVSYSGFNFMYGKSLISWFSRKQRCVSLSSAESEYVAITEACKEAIFMNRLMSELLNKDQGAVRLFNDNQSAQKMAYNPVFHNRTKHIAIRHHFIRNAVKEEKVALEYLNTEKMIADVMTKALPKVKHYFCMNALGITLV